MKWEIHQKEIINKTIKNRKKKFNPNIIRSRRKENKEFVNVYSYVLTDRKFVGNVTDSLKVMLIKEVVSKIYNINFQEMVKKSRQRHRVDARHALCYFLRKYTNLSYKNIGKVLENRNHATILSSCRTYQDFLDTEEVHRSKANKIKLEYNLKIQDVSAKRSYIIESAETINNWEDIKHKYLG